MHIYLQTRGDRRNLSCCSRGGVALQETASGDMHWTGTYDSFVPDFVATVSGPCKTIEVERSGRMITLPLTEDRAEWV